MKNNLKKKVKKIKSLSHFEKVKENNHEVEDYHMLLYTKRIEDEEIYDLLQILALEDNIKTKYAFLDFKAKEEKINQILKKLKNPLSDLVYIDGETRVREYKGDNDLEQIRNWIFDIRNPGVIEIGDKFVKKVIFNHNHALVLFVKKKNSEIYKDFSRAVLAFKVSQ